MPSSLKLYLFAYNSLQALGWSIVLVRVLVSVIVTGSFNAAYAFAGDLVGLLLIASFLEVVHGALGIVRSGALLHFLQWIGRTHYVVAIVFKIPEVQDCPSVFVIFLAWSISEVVRYLHYALTCIGLCPYRVIYLRYTTFISLYPVGLFGESWLMYKALPFIEERDLYADYFTFLPFSYYTFVQGLLVVYPFVWLKLYLHLLQQRSIKLGGRVIVCDFT